MSTNTRSILRRALPVRLVAPLALALTSTGAFAAQITVDTTADTIAADGACSLREAIGNANDNAQTNADCAAGNGNDSIVFALPDTDGNTPNDKTIVLKPADGGALVINDAAGNTLTIDGSSQDDNNLRTSITADADFDPAANPIDAGDNNGTDDQDNSDFKGDSRIFKVQSPTKLDSLRLTRGFASGNGGIILNSAALNIKNSKFVTGRAEGSSAQGGGIYNDAGGTLTVSDSTFQGNVAVGAGGAIADASGNGVTLTNVTITLNRAGGDATDDGTPSTPGDGAGLYLPDGGTLKNSSLATNRATRSGGGIYNGGMLVITDTGFTTNVAQGGSDGNGGGGIYNDGGTITLTGCALSGNVATGDTGKGGGILSDGGNIQGGDGSAGTGGDRFASNQAASSGGAVALVGGANASFSRASFQENTAGRSASTDSDGNDVSEVDGFGGAIYAKGGGSLTLDTVSLARNVSQTIGGGIYNDGATLDMTLTSFFSNAALGSDSGDGGGGMFNASGDVTATLARFLGNIAPRATDDGSSAGSGGGLLSQGGDVTFTDSEFTRNSAERAGGAIELTGGNLQLTRTTLGGDDSGDGNNTGRTPGNGGALHIGGGSATLDASTVSYNTAAQGGGLWNSGSGTLAVNNSTISNNNAVGSSSENAEGGGIYQVGGGSTTLRFTTVASNSANGSGGGIAVGSGSGGGVTVQSSIVAQNSAGNGAANYADDGSVTASNTITENAGLDGLQLYGGPTLTRPLQQPTAAGEQASAAVDAGDNSLCGGSGINNLDQRGAARPPNGTGNGSDCDAGAFERTGDPVLQVSTNGPSTAVINPGNNDSNDLVVLAFTLRNAGDSEVTVGGFRAKPLFNGGVGSLLDLYRNDPQAALDYKVFLDANDNGKLDAGETTQVGQLASNSKVEFDFNGGAGQLLAAGAAKSYLLVLQVPPPSTASASGTGTSTGLALPNSPLYAGGLLIALLAAFRLRGTRRRTQLLLALAALAIGLSACSNGDSPLPPLPGPDPAIQGELRFVITQLDAQGNGDQILIGDGLPVYGPAITVR